MATPINTILNWFLTGKKPTQAQFHAAWQSFWHKDETIPVEKVENLQTLLDNKADKASTGLFKIGDYMVDRKGGSNTTIKEGNIIYGTGAFFDGEFVIAEALQDDPTDDAHFSVKYQSL